jgi:hypothetical protein
VLARDEAEVSVLLLKGSVFKTMAWTCPMISMTSTIDRSTSSLRAETKLFVHMLVRAESIGGN